MTEKTEDKEFEEFLTIARKETLTDDDSKALQEALKAHPQWLKDQTKTDQMFPQPILKPGADGKYEEMTRSEACGFEKTDCMRNVINAAAALNKEKDADGNPILSDEAFGNFMGTTDSKTGRNFATVVARNLAANEFKSKKAQSQAVKDALDNNHESLTQTLEAIKSAAPDLIQTKDGNAMQAEKYMERTEAGAESRTAPQADAELEVSPQTNQGETYQIGGTANDLNVTPARPAGQDLNVEAEEEENMANIQPAGNEDQGKGEKPHFDRVKEQDIIDFMFNDWFLASINWSMEKIYGLADGAANKLCTAYQPEPKAQATAQRPQAPQNQPQPQPQPNPTPSAPDPDGRHQDDAPRQSSGAAAMFQDINRAINDLTLGDRRLEAAFKAAVEDIKNNIDKNRKPEDWQTTYLNPQKHKKLIEYCTYLHKRDPEAFNRLLENKETILKASVPGLIGEIKFAASAAVIAYVSDPRNLGKPIDEEALTTIRGRQKMILSDMKKTRDIMLQHNLEEYRANHHLDKDAQIDNQTMLQIQEKTVNQYSSYVDNVAQAALNVREDLAKYYDADDKTEARQNLDKSRKKLMDGLGGLGNIPRENDEPVQPRTQNDGTHDLRQEAVQTNEAENYEQRVTTELSRGQDVINGDIAQNKTRHQNFENNRNGPTQQQQQTPRGRTYQPNGGQSR